MSYWRGGWGIALMGKTKVENQIAAEVENSSSELWWKITISPNKSFFTGWVGWALRKAGFLKQKEYNPNDALDIKTTYDKDGVPTTTIRPKEDEVI